MRASTGSRAAGAALAALLVGVAAPAAASAVQIKLLTRVAEGQRPRIQLVVGEPVERLEVSLARDDGRNVSARFGALAPGATREVVLPGDPGKHRWEGRLSITQRGTTRDDVLSFESQVLGPLRVEVDKSRVDLAARTLPLRMTRPAGKVEVKVYGATARAPLAEEELDFTGRPPGEWLAVTWPALPGGEPAARIDLKVFDADGFYVGLSAVPWSVHIPHEEVNFATDSATITAAEEPKLARSLELIAEALARHRELGPIKLFIAGHTDTQGSAAYNVKLSQRRAQAIAAWFRRRGLRIPIAFEGFGEHAPLVATPDETDEPRNRRVDYILAVEEPALRAAGGFRPAWKRIP